jgi:transposase-like protein
MSDQDTTSPARKLLTFEEYTEKVKNLKSMEDVNAFVKDLVAPAVQTMLEAEMTHHLGYEKHDPKGKNSGNSRNGHSRKTLKTSFGTQEIAVPRDRNGGFEPVAVRKYETVQSDIEERIVSMYAKGMSTRDIHAHMEDIYGVDVSADMVSTITDKVLPLVQEWQNRPLSSLYAVLYLDGIHFKVREGGKVVNKCAYVILGINGEGAKEILGIWIGGAEGAKFWLGVLTEIKNRGVEDILICCIDGLTGFSEAIKTVYPHAEIQQCIVHMVRNTVKYVSHQDRKSFCADLRRIYTAPTEEAGLSELAAVQGAWPKYDMALKRWEQLWDEVSTCFKYPDPLRKIIYTNNAIENLNRQFRKVTKTTTIFPHEESLRKLLWLAHRDIAARWKMTTPHWGQIVSQLAIHFPNRITL